MQKGRAWPTHPPKGIQTTQSATVYVPQTPLIGHPRDRRERLKAYGKQCFASASHTLGFYLGFSFKGKKRPSIKLKVQKLPVKWIPNLTGTSREGWVPFPVSMLILQIVGFLAIVTFTATMILYKSLQT